MSRYFENFGIMQYNDQYCRSLTNRTAISQDAIKAASVFYPYQVREGERTDTLSFMYYDDSGLDWLVYFANDTIDPYYGWHLTAEQFNAYITSKYGSIAYAQLKVHHYQVSYANDDRTLSVSAYNALPSVTPTNVKKYWMPMMTETGVITHYVRKPDTSTLTTNRILRIDLPSTTGYEMGELVSQQTNNVVTGYAEITLIDVGYMLVQNTLGSFTTNSALIGFNSGTQVTPTTITVTAENIPTAEVGYWAAVSVYDYEDYLNEQRKTIRVIDKSYAELAQQNLKMMMK